MSGRAAISLLSILSLPQRSVSGTSKTLNLFVKNQCTSLEMTNVTTLRTDSYYTPSPRTHATVWYDQLW